MSDKVVLVTAASRGIGYEIAKDFALSGAKVVISSRKEENLKRAMEEIKKISGNENVDFCVANQGNPKDLENLMNFTLSRFGKVDILICNAATNPVMGFLYDYPLSAWQKILDVSLTGNFYISQLVAKHLIERRSEGVIIFISSIAGLKATPLLGAYAVAKAGLISLTKTLAYELAPLKIRVNAVAPGLIKTSFSKPLQDLFESGERDNPLLRIPLGFIGEPKDVSSLVLFLSSDKARYITGAVFVVDGGASV